MSIGPCFDPEVNEWNWKLKPLTDRRGDHLPNPKTSHKNSYVPLNGQAIGDLMDWFNVPVNCWAMKGVAGARSGDSFCSAIY